MSLAQSTNSRKSCQTQKHGRNEIITAAKILLTNQMILIINCALSSIVFGGCTQRTRFHVNFLKFDCTFVFSYYNYHKCVAGPYKHCSRNFKTFCFYLQRVVFYL